MVVGNSLESSDHVLTNFNNGKTKNKFGTKGFDIEKSVLRD